MAMGAPRHRTGFLLLLLLVGLCSPAWSQSGDWMEVSRAGLQAADESRFDEAERLFREALRISEPFAADDTRRATTVNNHG